MARRERKSDRLPEGWLQGFIEAYDIQTTDDIKEALKDLVGGTIETMMEAELETDLGYAKHDKENKKTNNSRNGSSSKTLRTEYGDVTIAVPRDRESEFEPKIVPKHQREIKGLDKQIISMYAKGMTTRDISSHIDEIYGFGLSEGMVSKITNKILPTIEE